MSERQKLLLTLAFVFILSSLAGFFSYEPLWNKYSSFRAWSLGLDLAGGSYLVYEIDTSKIDSKDTDSVIKGLRDVIERRVNLFGVSEPRVYAENVANKNRLIVELAGIKDVKEAIKQIGETPFLDFREVVEHGTSSPEFILTSLNGRYVKSATLSFDNITGKSQVDIEFSGEGAEIFSALTEKNINKPLAIFLDDALIEMPMVREKISGGKAQITGNFTLDEAKKLVERFNAGALPAPIQLINQQTIGASLGTDSLKKTITAGLIGSLAVVFFMILYYQFYGLAASLALIIYIFLTLTVFKLMAVTMTLAGIAGFVLSIGMAVDANVLIFERRKEEIRKGISSLTALEEGFKRAWPSIRDSNTTTIITSVILYYFTTGFVKGFALTLLIGVVVSMFSAITVTRTILKSFVK